MTSSLSWGLWTFSTPTTKSKTSSFSAEKEAVTKPEAETPSVSVQKGGGPTSFETLPHSVLLVVFLCSFGFSQSLINLSFSYGHLSPASQSRSSLSSLRPLALHWGLAKIGWSAPVSDHRKGTEMEHQRALRHLRESSPRLSGRASPCLHSKAKSQSWESRRPLRALKARLLRRTAGTGRDIPGSYLHPGSPRICQKKHKKLRNHPFRRHE